MRHHAVPAKTTNELKAIIVEVIGSLRAVFVGVCATDSEMTSMWSMVTSSDGVSVVAGAANGMLGAVSWKSCNVTSAGVTKEVS